MLKDKEKREKLKELNKIDKNFKNGNDDEYGVETILQSLFLTDLSQMYDKPELGELVRAIVIDNVVLREKKITVEKLEEIKSTKEYDDLVDSIVFSTYVKELKNILEKTILHFDIKKLLLISAFRFNDALENHFFRDEDILYVKEILQKVSEHLPVTNYEIECMLEVRYKNKEVEKEELQEESDKVIEEKVKYSVKDLKKCISKFAGDTYLTEEFIAEYKEKINSDEIKLLDIPAEYLEIIFSNDELEDLSKKSEENLIFVYRMNNWSTRKILDKIIEKKFLNKELLKALIEDKKIEGNQISELYNMGLISIENIAKIKNDIDLTQYIGFEIIDTYYEKIKNSPEDKEIINKYKRSLDLYKEVYINGKSKEEIEEISEAIFEKIVTKYSEGKEYYDVIKEYYKNGMMTFNTIKQWITEPLATELFKENLIDAKKIKEFNFSSDYYTALIYNNDIEYDTRFELIKQGFMSQDEILNLYLNNKLFEKDLQELMDLGLVNSWDANRLIKQRTLEQLEAASLIKLNVSEELTKKGNIYIDVDNTGNKGGIVYVPKPKNNVIIDPNKREELIKKLGFYVAKTNLSTESPFYNYQFYYRPDKTGKIGLDSIVIAERYYENKNTEEDFSVNNATYFFKYKDLMVLGSLKKSEMTKDRDDIVFTSNHVLAKEDKKGTWAKSIVRNTVKTSFSSSLKEYNSWQQAMIIRERLMEFLTEDNGDRKMATKKLYEILHLVKEIDDGEHNGIIHINEKKNKEKNGKKSNKNKEER